MVMVGTKHFGICDGILWVTNEVEDFKLGWISIKSDRTEEVTARAAHTTVRIIAHCVLHNLFTIRRTILKK